MSTPPTFPRLHDHHASRFAALALAGLTREYPNKLDHVLTSADDLRSPRALHPAFYGCYDWHSAVHAHWLLARVLRLHPDIPERPAIVSALDATLTPGTISAEIDYLARPSARAFERTYGWAWALKLHEELTRLASAGLIREAPHWAAAVEPMAHAFAGRYLEYIPRLTYPVRTGVHPNSAFGLMFAHDWATHTHHHDLRTLVESRARAYYQDDTDAPVRFEPSGSDFFSPSLLEADLMRRVLSPGEFADWLPRWLPDLAPADPYAPFEPAHVSDRTDPQIVHLDGLNLSRAWSMRSIATALWDLPGGADLLETAMAHEEVSLPHVASGDYMGEHWLATFATLALTGA